MNIPRFGFPLLGLLFSAPLACLTSCNDRMEFGPRSTSTAALVEDPGTPSAEASQPLEAKVTIEDFKFVPEKLSVRPGTKVTWVNQDDEPHSATSSEKPKRFDSGVLDTQGSFSFTFTDPGSFSYFCKLHPHMTGVIEVR